MGTLCLSMETKNKNYQKELQKLIDSVKNLEVKPKLLLHICCGPCSTIPLIELLPYFDITLIYNNSNIYPKEEYDRRLNEAINYYKEQNYNLDVITFEYDNLNYNKDLEPYADLPEGHERCRICFRKRLEFGFRYAKEHNFDYFGTVMTISRYKNALDINRIGSELSELYSPVKWLFADFKKNDGYEKSLVIIKEHHMYFQEYCGCIYSYKKYLEKMKNKDQK